MYRPSPEEIALLEAIKEVEEEKKRKERMKKYLELALPLLLSAILLLYIGSRTGIIPIGFENSTSVLILTAQNIPDNLTVYREAGYMFDIRNVTPSYNLRVEELAKYDVVVLYDVNELSFEQRESLFNYITKGGTLIVVKCSGTLLPESDLVNDVNNRFVGWYGFDNYMPVQIADCSIKNASGVLSLTFEELNVDVKNLEVTSVDVKEDSDVLGYIFTDKGKDVAIAYKRALLGKTVYFSYDPFKTPAAFMEVLTYIRKG